MPNHLNFTYLLATGKIPILMDIDVHQMTSRHQINTSPSHCRLDRQPSSIKPVLLADKHPLLFHFSTKMALLMGESKHQT